MAGSVLTFRQLKFQYYPHETNEYVCATTIIGSQNFIFISAYLQPDAKIDGSRLEDLITATAKTHIICGDLNAHNEIWGSSNTSPSRAKLADFLRHGIEPLNDSSIAFMKSLNTTSCIDLSFVTASMPGKFPSCTDIETRGSDHNPISILTCDSPSQTYEEQVACTDWRAFTEATFIWITAATRDDEIIPTILHCFRKSTSLRTKRWNQPNNDADVEYQRLCAICRREERKTLRTKSIEDLRTSGRAQMHVIRHLNKLQRKR